MRVSSVRFYLTGFVLFFALSGSARGWDTLPPPNKTHYKYLGIQANLLLQQFISFNSNASINNNPYLFSYSKNNIKTGAGTVFGTGLNFSQISSNDGVSSVNTKLANFTFRFGYEKKYLQLERFIPFWGIDMAAGLLYSDVTSILNQTGGSNFIEVETTKVFAGPSFRAGLHYALSKHILIGTEFFFNLQLSYMEQNASNGFSNEFAPFNIGFQPPTAVFLIFRY